MPAPFFLVGATAVGKTALAVEIAARCAAEIVNADPFQVYAGLDLLTSKPAPDALRRVRHHLVGVLPLAEEYNVARFREDAGACLADIAARGKRALVVGGSGLYIKALTHGLSPLPPPSPARRAELARLHLPGLLAQLRALDPAAIAVIDSRNPRRVIRAIEICEATGQPLAAARFAWRETPPAEPMPGLCLTRARADLHARIGARVAALLPGGVLDEVRRVPAEISITADKVIGLHAVRALLRGEIGEARCLAAIATATRQYAKRQMTWFRAHSQFERVDLTAADPDAVIADAVRRIQST